MDARCDVIYDHWDDAARYATHWIRDRWLSEDDLRARAAGQRWFFTPDESAKPEVGPNGGGATRFMYAGWSKLRDGEWSRIEDFRRMSPLVAASAFDGWWRECTPAERERLRGTVIRCAVHAPDDDACGAATPECKQAMRPTSVHRRYRERVIR